MRCGEDRKEMEKGGIGVAQQMNLPGFELKKNKKDVIVGSKFGKWKVIQKAGRDKGRHLKYLCQCECGRMKEVYKSALVKGDSKSCGCGKTNIKIGTKYGMLTVLEWTGRRDKSRKFIYKCECECGKITEVTSRNLNSGNTKSCGCYAQKLKGRKPDICIDLTGMQFGKQKVIRENGRNPKGEVLWLLRCECGREVSRIGGFLLKNPKAKRCPCQRNRGNIPQRRNVTKPRNNEQFANDIYNMYIKEGWSVRDAAAEEGYKVGNSLTTLLMEHVSEYKEKSIKRRDESRWAREMESSNKKSKLFRYEKDLQKTCVARLKSRGVVVKENDRETTGFEIDIKTNKCCYELKVTTPKKSIYRAMGQLDINTEKTGLKPVLVIPSDTTIAKSMMEALKVKRISVLNELNI